jgi:hypothetical protein
MSTELSESEPVMPISDIEISLLDINRNVFHFTIISESLLGSIKGREYLD